MFFPSRTAIIQLLIESEKLFLRMQLLLKSRVTTHWMITMHFLMMSVQS